MKDVVSTGLTLKSCNICPRNCRTNRYADLGAYCRSGADVHVSSVCIHKGEEPVIGGEKGVCNVFFAHCNLQCIYCQNYQISRNKGDITQAIISTKKLTESIIRILDQGIDTVSFVSPSHFVVQTIETINKIIQKGYKPIFVYNTNAYDTVDAIKNLDGIIDIYLPDFKYIDSNLARKLSGAGDYPQVASAAIAEMYYQKGSTLIIDENGVATQGIIIRHLVLPGYIENSKGVLKFIAENFSVNLHISLMSQYYPISAVANHDKLGKYLNSNEYDEVIDYMANLGFHRGWLQDMESRDNYKPDFFKEHPFEY